MFEDAEDSPVMLLKYCRAYSTGQSFVRIFIIFINKLKYFLDV